MLFYTRPEYAFLTILISLESSVLFLPKKIIVMTAKTQKNKNSKKTKHFGQTGYALHKSRLVYTGKEAIRSIKFPLKSTSQVKLDDFANKVISDYSLIQGATNINEYLTEYQNAQHSYSLIDFWVDSLRAGVVFAKTPAALTDFLHVVYQRTSPSRLAFDQMYKSLRSKLDYELFLQKIILSTGIRKSAGKHGILSCFKKEWQSDPSVLKEVDYIFSNLIKNGATLSQEEQRNFWKSAYNLQLPAKQKGANLTFYVLPELKFDSNMNISTCFSDRFSFFKKQNDSKLDAIFGFDNNFSAFSNYFGEILQLFKEQKTKKITDYLINFFDIWRGKEDELNRRLVFLSNQAQKLVQANIATNYADFRMSFGGKLQSWFSGYQNQNQKIIEQLNDHGEDLKKINDAVTKQNVKPEDEERKTDLLTDLADLQKYQSELAGGKELEFAKLDLYRDLLAFFRSDFNWFFQNYLLEEKEKKADKDISVNKKYKKLFKNLRLVPEFFGLARKKAYQKYIDSTIPIIKTGWQVVTDALPILRENMSYEFLLNPKKKDYFIANLEKFNRKLKTKTWNRPKFSQLSEKIVRHYNNNQVPTSNQVFYKNRFSNSRQEIILIDGLNQEKELKWLVNSCLECLAKPVLSADAGLMIDQLELTKMVLGWLINGNNDSIINFDKYDLANFIKASKFIEVFKTNQFAGRQLSRFLMSYIFGELRGAVGLFSRQSFVNRYVVSPMASLSNYPLVNDGAKWYLALGKSSKKPKEGMKEFTEYADKESDKAKPAHFFPDDLLYVSSSIYQMQFLHALKRQKEGKKWHKWQQINLKLSDHAFIVEDEYQVKWDLITGKPNLKRVAENRRVFVSVPFILNPLSEQKTQSENIANRHRYLGIDVGEYGLAYAVLDFSNKKRAEIIDQGFIYDGSLRKIRDHFDLIKDTQTKGTFSVPSTALSRVRENAITALRNKIHDLVLRFNAKPVYEFSISNFETGSGKVTKIYNSVKKADIYPEIDTDKAVQKHIWGKNPKLIGQEVSAYATSYTCSKCHQSIYDQGLDKESKIKANQIINASPTGLIKIKLVSKVEAWGFVKGSRKLEITENERTVSLFKGQKIGDEVAQRLVKNFARPPINEASEAIKLAMSQKKLNSNMINFEKLAEDRGNMAMFVCPFCLHVDDADIQAAQNIALRGFLKNEFEKDNNGKKESFNYIQAVKNFFQSGGMADYNE